MENTKAELILNNISRAIDLNPEEIETFVGLLEYQTHKKKEMLLKEGHVNHGVWYVTDGCLRMYNNDANDVEHILTFGPKDWWIADLYSVISGKPSSYNIQSVENSTTLFLSRENQNKLFDLVPKFEKLFRLMLEKSLVAHQILLMDRMTRTAQERYVKFTERYPSLVTTLSQKQIAAYIGVTPEFLSKIRTELFKKK
jgi:CRP-like cAMP-binding protein